MALTVDDWHPYYKCDTLCPIYNIIYYISIDNYKLQCICNFNDMRIIYDDEKYIILYYIGHIIMSTLITTNYRRRIL